MSGLQNPTRGMRVRTLSLGDTQGYFLAQRHITVRAAGLTGVLLSGIPGGRSDLWFVEHDHAEEFGAYSINELEAIESEDQSPQAEERTEPSLSSFGLRILRRCPPSDSRSTRGIRTLIEDLGGLGAYSDYMNALSWLCIYGYLVEWPESRLIRTPKGDAAVATPRPPEITGSVEEVLGYITRGVESN